MDKELKDLAFEELADWMNRTFWDALLRGGSKETRGACWAIGTTVIQWRRLQDEKERAKA